LIVCSAWIGAAACGRVNFGLLAPDGDPRRDGGCPVSSAPLAFVQVNAATTTGGSNFVQQFANPIVAGDLLVVTFDYGATARNSRAAQVTDSLGNAYTIKGPFDGTERQYIAYSVACASGTNLVTVTLDAPPDGQLNLYVHEYAGAWSADPFDAAAGATGAATTTDGATTPAITTTSTSELLFVDCTFAGFGSSGTGFAMRSGFHGNVTEDRVVNAPGSYAGTASWLSGGGWTISIAAFHEH
jgi:hypothetical protein